MPEVKSLAENRLWEKRAPGCSHHALKKMNKYPIIAGFVLLCVVIPQTLSGISYMPGLCGI